MINGFNKKKKKKVKEWVNKFILAQTKRKIVLSFSIKNVMIIGKRLSISLNLYN